MAAITPEQWQKIKPIFHAALERSVSARAAFLDEACQGDASVRAEVEALLAAHEDTSEFLAQPAGVEAVPHLFHATIELPVGQKLAGYEIQRKLGAGGMGEVYLARDVRLGRPVALKVLPARLTNEPNRVRRFQQEARAASALNHPNIITIYEVGEIDGVHFIATEYIDGPTLRALLKRGELTVGEVLAVVTQAGQALEASHRAGIVHRDIKPENLMRREDGFVKVLDFGLAKLTERPTGWETAEFSHFRTQPGVVMGTVAYMSPEQARGQEVDARSDVFSLGVVLYEMLTGRVPFEGETTSDMIAALLAREAEPLDRYVSGLPAAFQRITERALQKRREDRYANISEMLAELRALKDELEITAKLKRSGKTKLANASLLEMRVGQPQAQATRTTNQRAEHTTARFSTVVVWMKKRPMVALSSVLLLLLLGIAIQAWYAGKLQFERNGTRKIDSIAVLPFADQTKDAQLAYLPDGLTEGLISNLSQLPELAVMARGTVFTYKGQEVDPRAVGKALKVNAVVQGRVVRQGQQLTISVELVDAATGALLWGRDYFPAPDGVLSVKNELTRELGAVLRPQLSGAAQQQFAKPATADNEVWQLYLRGKHLVNRGSLDGYQKALEYFEQSVIRDPRFAPGHAGIADMYSVLSDQYLLPHEAMPKARQAVLTALQLDETLPEAHKVMARIKWWNDWDWAGARLEFQRAIELNPNLTEVRVAYASLLSQRKRLAEAEAEIRRVEALDPLSFQLGVELGQIFYFSGRDEAALAQFRKMLELYPGNPSLQHRLALIFTRQGRHQEAVNAARQAVALDSAPAYRARLAYVLARAGQRAEALSLLRDLQKRAVNERISPTSLARVHVGLGDHEQALHWLRKSYDEHSDHILSIGVDPVFDPLRADPRFQELLRGAGLAD